MISSGECMSVIIDAIIMCPNGIVHVQIHAVIDTPLLENRQGED